MHQLVLLRHGESEWNKLNLFTGWHDVRLTELGPNSCRISWVGEFDARPVVGAVMQRFLHFVLGDFVRRLRRYAPTA